MAEEGFVGGNLFDKLVILERRGADGREDSTEQLGLLFRVLGELRRRKFKAFVDFLKTGHEERNAFGFHRQTTLLMCLFNFIQSEIEMQGFNFSKINFSAPPKAALEQGNNSNSGENKRRRVSVRNSGAAAAAANAFSHYLSPIVASLPAKPVAAAWNASQVKPALPNNMQRKLTTMARSGSRYTSKNRKVFNRWNRNIEKMEHPEFVNNRASTAKKTRSASRSTGRSRRN